EMKARDLIESYKSSDDSRVTLVALNDKAKAMVPQMEKQCDAIDTAMRELKDETGIDLWEAVSVVERHLRYRPISARVDGDSPDIKVVDYAPKYREAFKSLNVEWISKYWELEEPDFKALDDPEGYILNQSGVILIALDKGEPIGCCALIKQADDTFELAKMAVSPKAQGKGVGLLLGKSIVERAKLMGLKRLYLESNSVLKPAICLYEKIGFKPIKGASSPYARCDVQMELLFK
ncbi:MAG: GNAT family N-acetyltransferase, partial [Pseudomonadota bacterium]